MKRYISLLLLLFIIAACTPTEEPVVTPEVTESPYDVIDSICLVTDVGTISDNTFNQYAYEGMIDLTDEFASVETSYVETIDPENYTANIQQCIDNEADIITTVGFSLTDSTLAAAVANPDVYFIGIDQDVASITEAPDNYTGVQAAEDEAGFLVGAIAASVANSIDGDVIAGVYGIDFPALKRFRNGYEQGALYINPDWVIGENILGQYTDSFIDTELGATIAQDYIEQGAVVIFGAGGLTGSGAIVQAASQGVYVIGVDQDEYFTTFEGGEAENAEYIITSAVKRVDRGVFDIASLLLSGQLSEFPGGSNYLLNVFSNGIGFTPTHDADIPEEIIEQASAIYGALLRQEISTGVDPITGNLIDEMPEAEATEASE
ncbi:MAG: BMP family ABC transporter substrate-binding protein [Phototrophicaceae bacterium]